MQCNAKPKLTYPLKWSYRLIIDSSANIGTILKNILNNREYNLENSKTSKNGKYKSYNITLLVYSDEDRQTLYESFKKDKNVKMVL